MTSRKLFSIILLICLLVGFSGTPQPVASAGDPLALVAVPLQADDTIQRFQATGLPAYALLDGYILAGADSLGQQALAVAGLPFQVMDAELGSGYYLATRMPSAVKFGWSTYGQVLLDLGEQALLQTSAAQAEQLSLVGAELRYISLNPISLPVAQSTEQVFPEVIPPDPIVQMVIDQVSQDTVSQYDRELAGELPVWVDGDWYTITSRNTYSGTPIQKATSYVGQRMAAEGLDVEYHVWGGNTYPNVIGEITGLTTPEDIFIIGAHLDDVSGSPGADDNGSGSVATMIAAELLSQYEWSCTVRFALWTGEEQGLNGSDAYAQRSYNLGENIVGYLNLDMIAWNTPSSSPDIDLIYNPNMPPTQQLAQLMSDVIDAYDINLIPQLITSLGGGSDHQSFWDRGYTSILAIEDQGDFNPYYHSSQDTPAHTDLPYFTEFTKASIATFMHMSGCVIVGGTGNLDGTVTAVDGGAPIPYADIQIDNGAGNIFNIQTDDVGYYTQTLLAGTYTVTASAYAYLPETVSGVTVVTDTVTTQDFSLLTAPTYIISGTVTESGTGLPLYAHVTFDGSPVETWSDPSTGFYQAELPQGTYTMNVVADLHRSQSRPILVDQNQTQDFVLEPLPCILLVDDDNNAPDTLPYYTAALATMGYDYDVFDTGGGNGPGLAGLQGYKIVLWFSGDTYGGTAGPNGTDEGNLTAYLDSGGELFLDSQDYLYDMGVTTFGQAYLGIASRIDDDGHAVTKYGVAGDPVGGGLGPYPLTYPSGFTDYGDIVYAAAGASTAYRSASGGGGNPLDVDKDGGDWKTVFFGTSWVPIYNNNSDNGVQSLGRIIEWFGGCQPTDGQLEGTVTDASTGDPLEGVSVTVVPARNHILSITDPNGFYSMTLPAGDYLVTAEIDGYVSQTLPATVEFSVTTTLDFALEPVVVPPEIDVTPSAISVTLSTGEYTTEGVTVSNLGGSPLSYTVSNPGSATWLSFEPAGGKIDPAASQVVSVTLDTTELGAGIYTTTLEFASDDPNTPLVVLPITLTVLQSCTPVSDVDFSWVPASPLAGEVVTFTASFTGSEPFTFLWEFSDGITSTAETPARTFAPGVYTVTLTVSNGCGVADVSYTITVAAPPLWFYLPLVSKN